MNGAHLCLLCIVLPDLYDTLGVDCLLRQEKCQKVRKGLREGPAPQISLFDSLNILGTSTCLHPCCCKMIINMLASKLFSSNSKTRYHLQNCIDFRNVTRFPCHPIPSLQCFFAALHKEFQAKEIRPLSIATSYS
jgi:hypothetical protein